MSDQVSNYNLQLKFDQVVKIAITSKYTYMANNIILYKHFYRHEWV